MILTKAFSTIQFIVEKLFVVKISIDCNFIVNKAVYLGM